MLNVRLEKAKVHVAARLTVSGSVVKQTREAHVKGFTHVLDIESPDDPARVAAAIRNASNGCFTERSIEEPTPVTRAIGLNSAPFHVDDHPAASVRR